VDRVLRNTLFDRVLECLCNNAFFDGIRTGTSYNESLHSFLNRGLVREGISLTTFEVLQHRCGSIDLLMLMFKFVWCVDAFPLFSGPSWAAAAIVELDNTDEGHSWCVWAQEIPQWNSWSSAVNVQALVARINGLSQARVFAWLCIMALPGCVMLVCRFVDRFEDNPLRALSQYKAPAKMTVERLQQRGYAVVSTAKAGINQSDIDLVLSEYDRYVMCSKTKKNTSLWTHIDKVCCLAVCLSLPSHSIRSEGSGVSANLPRAFTRLAQYFADRVISNRASESAVEALLRERTGRVPPLFGLNA
jgi:hypothetical protein